MNIDESKVPPQAMTAVRESLDAAYGSTHKGDPSLARDLGVTLSVEQDEVTPPAEFVGNSLVNKPVNDAARAMRELPLPQGEPFRKHYKEMSIQEQGCFRQGMIYASMTALKQKAYTAHTAIISEVHTLRGEA